jgi:hypothetical protein
MALIQSSNQTVVQHATEALTTAIHDSSTFASWVGWEAYQGGATLEQAIAIVNEIEAGHYSLNDLFNSAQSKVSGSYAAGINGEPNPTLTVNGQTFEIGHLLGETTVEEWASGSAKNVQYHSREYFTKVGDAPEGFDPHWDSPNQAPVAEDFTVAGIEGNGTLVINLLDHVSDPDGDALIVSNVTLANGDDLPSYMTFDAATGKVTVDLDAAALNDIHKDDIQTVSLSYSVSDGQLSDDGAIKVDITGTADQYHGLVDVSKEFIKTAVNSGNGGQTAESFHFDLHLPTIDDAFDFSGTVTLTVKGDIDGLNENATVTAISGELVDENVAENGLLYLSGTIGNNDDKNGSDIGDNVTVTGSTDVGANGFADGHVVFDVAVSGDVDTGSTVSATLSYDYWA